MLQRRRFAQWGASGLLAPALGALPKAQAAADDTITLIGWVG